MLGNQICLDTSILIDFLDGVASTKKLFDAVKNEEISPMISSIVECELFSTKKIDEIEGYREKTDFLLSLTEIKAVDRLTARKAGEFRRKYNVKTPDAIIAATAFFTKDKILATNNKADFSKIKEIKVYSPKEITK